ncbi:MAG: FHA domain-containing serine/threonine-protein kinase [Anaerolineales bacterium]|nr:FHA domain-containing serine/threonine-protein kinase [Anaerolineales bacterium]
MDNLVGQTLNRYKITALIGEGGMGAVFKAHDVTLQRDVAIKIMHGNFAHQEDFQQRFLQEARTAARLDHPGIIQVYDFGSDRGRLYIVMKFIAGDNLEKMLRDLRQQNRWIPLVEAVGLIRQVALALDYAHRQGVLHRDIKPANIMIEPEPSDGLPYRPVITDLGLAKLVKGGFATQDHASMGTPAYMSPEQALGQTTDARSDVYSLGVLLFELATGRLPFPARSILDAIQYHVQTPPPAPRSLRQDLPESLEKIILQAMQKEPASRFQNAGALAEALKSTLPEAAKITEAPAGAQATLSLFTQYQNSLIEPRGASIFADFAAADEKEMAMSGENDQAQERIQILAADQTTKTLLVKRPTMSIGRDPDNDIALNDPKASRQHARLEFDGHQYVVVDLNSTNGTYLGGTRLIPGVPRVWGVADTLRIGDSYLRLLRPGESAAATLAATTAAAPPATTARAAPPPYIPPAEPTRQAAAQPSAPKFSSDLQPARLQPGQVGVVTIQNLSDQPDVYTLSWDSPSGEVEFTPPYLHVNAAAGQEVVVEFRPDLRRANFFGGEKRYNFSAMIRSNSGAQKTHQGEVISRAALPTWSLPLMAIVCLGLAVLSIFAATVLFGGGDLLSGSGAQTQTVAYTQTQLALANDQTATAVQATTTALADANLATQTAATATGVANATLLAATQTGVQESAQTAIALTAQAQQATFEAGANQTAQALQATQQAAAAQTANAIQLTNQAGVIQTSAALTAISAQLTHQAQSATLTAAAQRRVAYIFSSDNSKANDYKSFLQSQGYIVDLIPIANVLSTEFTPYKAILIAPETGNAADYQNNPWGDPAEVQANTVAAYNKPIIGLGRGGSLFFQAIGLFINWGQSWVGSTNEIYVVNPSATFWNTPNSIAIPGDQIIKLYDNPSGFLAVYLPGPIAGVVTVGRQSNDADHYPLIIEGSRFFLWGFDDGPSNMSNKGQRAFLNILWNLAP